MIHFLRSVLILFIVFITVPCFAFLNIESVRQGHGKGFNGRAGLSYKGQSGNTNRNLITVDSTNSFKEGKNEYLALAKYRYGDTSKIKDTNDGFAHLRWTRALVSFPSVEVFAQVQFNEFMKLNLRQVYGSGLRWEIFKSETTFLFFGTGAFYEKENLEKLPIMEDVRGSTYLSFLRKVDKKWEASIIVYYQPLIDRLKDFRIQVTSGLNLKLNSKLSLNLQWYLSHDSFPPPGVELTDSTYLVGAAVNY